jgi:hypothetical protein
MHMRSERIYLKYECRYYMFRRHTCAILRELKVPDEMCFRYVMDAEDSESGC